jgi:hypothetical protein
MSTHPALPLIGAIQGALTPDLLTPAWRARADHPHAGHCYVASEALWYALGASAGPYRPHVARQGEITHWWLNGPQGPLDPTADQFPDGFDYALGHGCGFLTKGISARAAVLLSRALPAIATQRNEATEAIAGTRVRVYRNLHTGTWSAQDTRTGRVTAHPPSVVLTDASFVVRPAGRAKVLATGRKNVHAFVVGTVATQPPALTYTNLAQATYNPYRFASFMAHRPGDPRGLTPVSTAEFVWLDPHKRVLLATL